VRLDRRGRHEHRFEQQHEKHKRRPIRGWRSEVADRHVRFVFSNEPTELLAFLGVLAAARGSRPV